MTPDILAKSGTEHSQQRALFAWANMAVQRGFAAAWDDAAYTVKGVAASYDPTNGVAVLARLHAIPNGGYRDAITAGKLKAEGVKRGVPDVFLPLPMKATDHGEDQWNDIMYCGLYVEMKRPQTMKPGKRKALIVDQIAGSTSDDQDEWITYLRQAGYAVCVVFSWREAAQQIESYVRQSGG